MPPPAIDPRIGRPKRTLIIGGGPAGLITLHEYLSPHNRAAGDPGEAEEVALYERRAEIGGVWFFESDNDVAKGWPAPGKNSTKNTPQSSDSGEASIKPHEVHINGTYASAVTAAKHQGETFTQADVLKDGLRQPSQTAPTVSRWASPAYHGLVGNVLPPLLEFSAKPIDKPAHGLFPSMVETHKYLLDFAAPMRSHIKTHREVTNIQPVFVGGTIHEPVRWSVTSNDWSSGEQVETTEEWDVVIVAPGINEHPYYPAGIQGLDELLNHKSQFIMHAKTYSGPLPFVNQHNKIAVVGNGNSANDICAHLAPLNSDGPLFRCARHEGRFAHLEDDRIEDVAALSSIALADDKLSVTLTLTDGMVMPGVTKVIFATGYQFDFPWLHVPRRDSLSASSPSLSQVSPADLKPASKYGAVIDIHEQMFHATAPRLCFIGLPTCSIPLPLAEVQARVAARVYHNMLSLPADDANGLLAGFRAKCDELGLRDDSPEGWRLLHFMRGPEERRLTSYLLDWLERGEAGSSAGLFRWDERREEIAKGMRAVKEGELKRLRDMRIAAGGVDGGPGGVLAVGYEGV